MATTKQFLKRRQTGIGGSDVGAIVGVDPYRSALDVYLEKVGEAEPTEQTPVQQRGIYLEPIVRDLFKERTERKVKKAVFKRDPEHVWMIGHPDYLIAARDPVKNLTDERGILECKTMSRGAFKKVVERGVPAHHQFQGLYYDILCKHRWASIAILQPDSFQFVSIDIELTPELEKQIVEVCEHFWFNHVVVRIPPKPVELEWTVELPSVEGLVEDRTDSEWRDTIATVHERKALLEEAKELYDASRSSLKALCGRFGVFEGAGARVYFKQRERKGGLDTKALAGAGLLDPVKVMHWLGENYEGQISAEEAAELRADLEQFRKQSTLYDDLRVYHVADQEAP